MTIPPQKYEVGYGRSPKSTRWKKGQCGNPNRIRKRASKRVVEMIDEFFAAEIDVVEKGISRRVSNFEVATRAGATAAATLTELVTFRLHKPSRWGSHSEMVGR
jgi:Family of unknown function (DUF5681)